MVYRIAFRPRARADFLSIYDFVARSSNETMAESVVSRIETACQGLTDFPFRGSRRDDLGTGLRSITAMQRATIVYRVEAGTVRILRFFYAGRDYGAEDFSG